MPSEGSEGHQLGQPDKVAFTAICGSSQSLNSIILHGTNSHEGLSCLPDSWRLWETLPVGMTASSHDPELPFLLFRKLEHFQE